MYMEHPPGQLTCEATEQASVNVRELKSYQVIFSNHNITRLEINYKQKNCKKHKHVETKYTTNESLKMSKKRLKNT